MDGKSHSTFGNVVAVSLLAVIVSFQVFPVGFVGLPESLNSKQILAVLGVLIYLLRGVRNRKMELPIYILISAMLAVIFSVWCYFSVVENGTADMAYATYVRSFAIWLASAYAVVSFLKAWHGSVDIALLTKYLAVICVAQCVFALLVDLNPGFQDFVDAHFIQDKFPKEVNRLYGIGCSLDSGGVRFCFVLILIAHQIATNKSVTSSKKALWLYMLAYMFITVAGCMVARTTTIGSALGLGYIFITLGFAKRGVLSARQIRFYGVFIAALCIAVGITVYLYNTDAFTHSILRFAFEGFFNFFETGEFRTGSTDRLNEVMWVWPHDAHGWLIGYGKFEHSSWGYFSTDIGYCRFSLYCGLIGMAIFSLFFMYNASVLSRKFANARILSLVLLSLSFIIWIKVSTDIFQFYALLFCLAGDYDEDGNLLAECTADSEG